MMPAAKHGDPQMGVDIHLCVVPPSPSPVPLPTPHMSIIFDPFDYLPIIGATITVCGMKRATAGTNGIVVHTPPGFRSLRNFPIRMTNFSWAVPRWWLMAIRCPISRTRSCHAKWPG